MNPRLLLDSGCSSTDHRSLSRTHLFNPAWVRVCFLAALVAWGGSGYAFARQGDPAPLRERLSRVGADVYTRPERIPAAITELKAILGTNPESSDAHMLLGIAYRTVGSPEMIGEAKAELVQAVELNGANLPARYVLASLYLELGRPAKAREELEASIAQAPGRPQLLALLAEAERQSTNPTRAVELARAALRPDATFAQARYYLALALFDLGQRDEAIAELEQVVGAGPPLVDPYVSLGSAYLDANRPDPALSVLGVASKIDPARADIHILLARGYRLKNLTAKAAQELLLAAPQTSNAASSGYTQQHVDFDLALETGLVRLQQGRLPAAAAALKQALDMDPDHGPANRAMAQLSIRQGAYAQAAGYAARAEKAGTPLSEADRTRLAAKPPVAK
ncbi:MAG: tetratricopeptide repeat protein [Vicinamibacterales bacterium]